MMGDYEAQMPGLYLLAANETINNLREMENDFSLFVSFYEIYCGKLYDLLANR